MFCRLLFDVSFAPLPRRDVVGRSPDADALLLCESLGADVAQFIDRIVAIPRKSRTQHQIGHVVVVARGGDHPHALRGASALGRHLDAALQDHVVEVFARLVPLRLILEPGSAFTWRTGYLVSTVEDIVENGGVHTAMLDVSFACHMPDCLEMPYKPAIVGAREPQEGDRRWRMGGNSCLAGDYCGDWAFDHELQVGERIIFEDMIHYTMVKTTMFNGVAHPAIAIVRRDGAIEIIREFGYEDFKSRMS